MALTKAGINIETFLALEGLWENADELEKKRKEKNNKERGEGNVTLLCIGLSQL